MKSDEIFDPMALSISQSLVRKLDVHLVEDNFSALEKEYLAKVLV